MPPSRRTSSRTAPRPTQTRCKGPRSRRATDDEEVEMSHDYKALTREELNTVAGEKLPERAAMSLINANVAAPINAALALNVASDNSIAYANAVQSAPINQS